MVLSPVYLDPYSVGPILELQSQYLMTLWNPLQKLAMPGQVFIKNFMVIFMQKSTNNNLYIHLNYKL